MEWCRDLLCHLLYILSTLSHVIAHGTSFISIGPGALPSNKTLVGGPRSVIVLGSCEFMHNGSVSSVSVYIAATDWLILQIWRPLLPADGSTMQIVYQHTIKPNKTNEILQIYLKKEISIQKGDKLGFTKINDTLSIPYVFNPKMSADLWYHRLENDQLPLKVGDVVTFEELGFPYHFSVTVTFRPGDPDEVDFNDAWKKGFANNGSKDYLDYHEYYYGNGNYDDMDRESQLADATNFLDYVEDRSRDLDKHKEIFQKIQNSAADKGKKGSLVGNGKLHSIISSGKLHHPLNTTRPTATKTPTKLDKSRDESSASLNSSVANNGSEVFDGTVRTVEGSGRDEGHIDSGEAAGVTRQSLSDTHTSSQQHNTTVDNTSSTDSITHAPTSTQKTNIKKGEKNENNVNNDSKH